MKTSHSGHSVLIGPPRLRLSPLRCPLRGSNSRLGTARRRSFVTPLRSLARLLLRMRNCCVAHPRAVFPSLHARTHALAVARPIALEDVMELVPIDRADVVMTSRLVPFELRIGHRN